ncbi:hypothetical protein Syun_009402 [Stephania yunnanensis]|uniref:Uncharacterized protein n=1 Tax=Stephania yunnanensis TaxID=152371 RepID=A0AAP0KEF8_9MAGN
MCQSQCLWNKSSCFYFIVLEEKGKRRNCIFFYAPEIDSEIASSILKILRKRRVVRLLFQGLTKSIRLKKREVILQVRN